MKYYRLRWPSWVIVLCLGLMTFSFNVLAEHSSSLPVNDEVEIDLLHIGENAPVTVIWFACNQGDETAEFETAREMLKLGYQFYFPDMLSAHFLSPTASNIGKVPANEIVLVIQHIIEQTDAEQVYLVGGARAAVPVLKGLADPSIRDMDSKLIGALLITPRINEETPEPGAEPVYIDAAGLSKHPIRVLEGERTPNRWGLPYLKQVLGRSGSPVETEIIKGVRGFFYLRNDKSDAETEMTRNLPELIHQNIQKLGALKP